MTFPAQTLLKPFHLFCFPLRTSFFFFFFCCVYSFPSIHLSLLRFFFFYKSLSLFFVAWILFETNKTSLGEVKRRGQVGEGEDLSVSLIFSHTALYTCSFPDLCSFYMSVCPIDALCLGRYFCVEPLWLSTGFKYTTDLQLFMLFCRTIYLQCTAYQLSSTTIWTYMYVYAGFEDMRTWTPNK